MAKGRRKIKNIFLQVFFLWLLFSTLAQTWAAETFTPTTVSTPVMETKPVSDGYHLEPFPMAAIMSPYGLIAGAGLKLVENKTESYFSFSAISSFTDYISYGLGLKWNQPGAWFFRINGTFGNDVQDYYGEGDQTPNTDQLLKDHLNRWTFIFQAQCDSNFSVGPYFQYLNRDWTNISLFPNESEWKAGIQAIWDDRFPLLRPFQGSYYKLGVYTLPADGDDGINAEVFQFEGEARFYQMFLDPIRLVSRVRVAFTSGDPSYSFRYNLGGEWELRGYNTNRFRGNNLCLIQEEARFPLFPFVEGALSVDAGDVSDTLFMNRLLWSFQGGLRSEPIPSMGLLVRLDWGFGNDDNEVWLDIGEPF